MARLLIVDDEPSILEFFEILLKSEGYEVETVSSGREAIARLDQQLYDLVITDLSMPEVDGMAVLDRVKEVSADTLVLMITAFATAESAVEAMKRGAYDYLMKPFKVDEIRLVLRNALEKSALRRENQALRREVNRKKGFSHLIGESQKMQRLFDLIERVAAGRSSVLIVGESGTGKELVAKAIHENSSREGKPFVSVNCAAIPETLIESELFGYVRGAFTGATSNKRGLFEAAHEGTFFLDEIAELPSQVQVKLLRVLQERAVLRLGSTSATPVDVRILSATNRDLDDAVRTGDFREDLFYRLNVIQIRIPPLRERKEDIPVLARHFLEKYSKDRDHRIKRISDSAMDRLMAYDYPGNVRELENVIEQCMALEIGEEIRLESLPEKVRTAQGTVPSVPSSGFPTGGLHLEDEVMSYERALLVDALRVAGGVKKRAAELLNISFRSFRYRLLKHGLDTGEDETE
ncbi:MAG TPA: sigma-54 dependent transcriptional regulator [Bdellovibrionota bacterium]|nr:sigma-54 dependent transcriptional regulator [Bdellovibrionota bacterium]